MGAITKPAEQNCPICGADNDCAVAAGRDPATCWCVERTFPSELLDSDPARRNPGSCICRSCLERAGHER